ncbi:uncharacterized protein [Palaemon carinicauda]|uniref:uncharacterized protein isoform X2 n=1 Tax=Palaemon carinicauda TaxID=392227 RepID=UPI0035B656DC
MQTSWNIKASVTGQNSRKVGALVDAYSNRQYVQIFSESLDGLKTHTEELTASKSHIQKKYDAAVDAKVNQLKVAVTQREAELQRLRQQLHRRSCNASSCTTSSGGSLSGYRTGCPRN